MKVINYIYYKLFENFIIFSTLQCPLTLNLKIIKTMMKKSTKTMIHKPKLLEIISYAIFLRSQLLQDRNRKMSLISLDPKFTDGEANGKKEVLENSNFWSTRRQALSEFWWEPKKLTNVSSTTLSKLNKFSVNWKHSRLAIMPGLGLHMIFQIKNHKLKNFAPNSPQKKTIKSLKLYLKRLVKTTKSF